MDIDLSALDLHRDHTIAKSQIIELRALLEDKTARLQQLRAGCAMLISAAAEVCDAASGAPQRSITTSTARLSSPFVGGSESSGDSAATSVSVDPDGALYENCLAVVKRLQMTRSVQQSIQQHRQLLDDQMQTTNGDISKRLDVVNRRLAIAEQQLETSVKQTHIRNQQATEDLSIARSQIQALTSQLQSMERSMHEMQGEVDGKRNIERQLHEVLIQRDEQSEYIRQLQQTLEEQRNEGYHIQAQCRDIIKDVRQHIKVQMEVWKTERDKLTTSLQLATAKIPDHIRSQLVGLVDRCVDLRGTVVDTVMNFQNTLRELKTTMLTEQFQQQVAAQRQQGTTQEQYEHEQERLRVAHGSEERATIGDERLRDRLLASTAGSTAGYHPFRTGGIPTGPSGIRMDISDVSSVSAASKIEGWGATTLRIPQSTVVPSTLRDMSSAATSTSAAETPLRGLQRTGAFTPGRGVSASAQMQRSSDIAATSVQHLEAAGRVVAPEWVATFLARSEAYHAMICDAAAAVQSLMDACQTVLHRQHELMSVMALTTAANAAGNSISQVVEQQHAVVPLQDAAGATVGEEFRRPIQLVDARLSTPIPHYSAMAAAPTSSSYVLPSMMTDMTMNTPSQRFESARQYDRTPIPGRMTPTTSQSQRTTPAPSSDRLNQLESMLQQVLQLDDPRPATVATPNATYVSQPASATGTFAASGDLFYGASTTGPTARSTSARRWTSAISPLTDPAPLAATEGRGRGRGAGGGGAGMSNHHMSSSSSAVTPSGLGSASSSFSSATSTTAPKRMMQPSLPLATLASHAATQQQQQQQQQQQHSSYYQPQLFQHPHHLPAAGGSLWRSSPTPYLNTSGISLTESTL